MNNEMIDRIAEAILKKPDLFYMGEFEADSECGATHCIAGYAIVFEGAKRGLEGDFNEIHDKLLNFYHQGSGTYTGMAASVLEARGDIEWLFYSNRWPTYYYARYLEDVSYQGRAQIAYELLMDFKNGAVKW